MHNSCYVVLIWHKRCAQLRPSDHETRGEMLQELKGGYAWTTLLVVFVATHNFM
jgi:hypothetical protein